jgi:hypothetical protein
VKSRASLDRVERGRARTGLWAFTLAALAAPLGCSLAVSTEGLTGGDGTDGSGASAVDAGTSNPPSQDGGSVQLSTPEAGSTASEDGSTQPLPDASVAVDASSNEGSTSDSGSGTTRDAGTESGVDSGTNETPDTGAPKDAGHDSSTTPVNDGAPCSGDLSYLGTGDFAITFSLRTTTSGLAALLNQRSSCAPSTFWDVRFDSGQILVETDDVTNPTTVTTTGPAVNDGATHQITVARVSEMLTVVVDGNTEVPATSAKASFGALPALTTGSDVCDGQDGTQTLSGTISGICVGALAK